MTYHHVIAKLRAEEKFRALFSNLTIDELRDHFVKPYEMGIPFFAGNDLISPNDLRAVQIIRTEYQSEVEREKINRKNRERLERLNDSGSDAFFLSLGGAYEPQHIAEAGEDLTHIFIKGHPGFKTGRWEPSIKIIAWVAGILATVIAAGIVKWLGWL